jgi:4'-phosphopantetheinyl transferase EntD
MTKPMIRIHNAQTQEVIDREMNEEEFAQYKADQAEQIARAEAKAEAEAAKTAAQAKLAALGLTTDDLKALGL